MCTLVSDKGMESTKVGIIWVSTIKPQSTFHVTPLAILRGGGDSYDDLNTHFSNVFSIEIVQ